MAAKYTLGGVTIESEVPLPELCRSDAHAPDWTFRLGARRSQLPASGWFHHWYAADGKRWLSFGRAPDAYLLRFARTATFRLAPGNRTIVCEGAARVPDRTIRHLFLNQVFPLALACSDRFVVHASAILDGSGAIGFAGHAGSGKSTLSAALSRTGRRLICDDALVIERHAEGFYAVPTYGSVRLWPDSIGALFGSPSDHPTVSHYTLKRLVHIAGAARPSESSPLRVLCLLAPPDAMRHARRVEARAVSRRDALIRLTGFTFQLDVQDPAGLRASFERLGAIVDEVPVVELTYPWRLAGLARTAGDVLDALSPFQ